jgi:GT2 family glycosyltransferase
MIQAAIYCVVYQTYQELYKYLDSIRLALSKSDLFEVSVFIADNTTEDYQHIPDAEFPKMHIHVYNFHKNYGYFGSIKKMMKATDLKNFNYIIISNVDVRLNESFFTQLQSFPITKNTGWIAPAIISTKDGCDLNPQATVRYTLKKLRILKFLYDHPLVMWIYENSIYRIKRHAKHSTGRVYAGHGSFIILTHEYIKRCGIINYPPFLYCEEIYLGEMCRLHHLTVNYQPSIVVSDIGGVSTGRLKRRKYYQYNSDATKYIIDTFYKA